MTDDLVLRARAWAKNRMKLDGGYSDEVALIRDLCDRVDKLERDIELTVRTFEHITKQQEEKNGAAHGG